MWCPNCGEAYATGAATCPDCRIDLIEESPDVAAAAAAVTAPGSTVVLGDFADFECELVLDILRAHGIYAYPARPAHDAGHSPYPFPGMTTGGVILVDAERAEEARRLVDAELPQHLDSIARAMEHHRVDDHD